ncbi:MAG: DUF559 domain-containing protein [Anaerolineales bacterium]
MPAKNIITNQPVAKAKLERAKELRHEMTPAEKLLWQEVRANKLGVRFRRQQVTPALACWCKCSGIHRRLLLSPGGIGCGGRWRCPRFAEGGR